MNYPVQPQNVPAPMPGQPQYAPAPAPAPAQQQQVQQYAPGQQQPVQQQQTQSVEFYGAAISGQDLNLVGQLYNTVNNALSLQLSDSSTVYKSLYFGSRDLFKTVYVNQISSQRGSKPTTPDYELAQTVYENTFGSVAQPRVNEAQLCFAMKQIAPNMLPDLVPGNRPHAAILDHIIMLNWHSQNARTSSNVNRNGNGNGNGNGGSATNGFPFAPNNNGGAQSKAAAVAGFPPAQQQAYVPAAQPMQQPMQQPQMTYSPQNAAQNVMAAMPAYAS